MRFKIIISLFIVFTPFVAQFQELRKYKIYTIAFYNVENLFDTVNDSLIFDDDRTPKGKDRWTLERFQLKIDHISKVISEIGRSQSKSSPDIVGLCEVENINVLEALISHPNLSPYDYGIIHYDSPDERGIDVALIFRKSIFSPTSFKSHRLLLFNEDEKRDYTRDQLVVGGVLDEEEVYIIVSHWPSRSGGEARSKPFRIAAAKLNKQIIDSISRIHENPNIIAMGDLNDNPKDDSMKKIIKTQGVKRVLETHGIFNAMENLYIRGAGSLAYRDKWSLFDQIYFTTNLIRSDSTSFMYWKAGIFKPSYLVTKNGKYKGYPYRTYTGGSYIGGYSDHFPVYVYFVKAVR